MRPDLNHFTSPRAPGHTEDIPQRLRELPTELPPPYGWAEFRRRSRNRFPPKTLVKWQHAAAAASLAAFVAAMAMLGIGDSSQHAANEDSIAPIEQLATGTAPQSITPTAQARETREWLARQPAEPALVRVGPRITVANLEDRIAWFDDALTNEHLQGVNEDHVRVLQQERARLVSSLAQVRYAEALAADGS
jgi:hypothetical protein